MDGAGGGEQRLSRHAVAPGATAVFGTSVAGAFVVDSNLGFSALTKGSARVLTTASSKASQSILCSAILADAIDSPPTSMTTLPVIRKTTQQGD